jgi:AcrR family transcriptional regulator
MRVPFNAVARRLAVPGPATDPCTGARARFNNRSGQSANREHCGRWLGYTLQDPNPNQQFEGTEQGRSRRVAPSQIMGDSRVASPRTRLHNSRRSNVSGRSTRELLILTAERLFAKRGIDAVSLREVGAAAGQRNKGIMQYYFGDRHALVDAIRQYRGAENDQRRLALLDHLERSGLQNDPRELVGALVHPLADQLTPDHYYVQFLARLHVERGEPFGKILLPTYSQGYVRVRDLIHSCVSNWPLDLFEYRFNLATTVMIHGLADFDIARKKGIRTLDSTEAFLEDLIDVLTAMVTIRSLGAVTGKTGHVRPE